MSSKLMKYVIVGGGNAAGYAALEYVNLNGPLGQLLIISNEAHYPYERPALSKGYLNPENPPRLSPTSGFYTCVGSGGKALTEDWYKTNQIEVLLNTNVKEANFETKELKLSNGLLVQYDKVILATGARPRTLEDMGISSSMYDNIYYLRDIQDADKLYNAMKSSPNGKAVVIGAGYIGLECTAALIKNGLQVQLVYPSANFLPRLFPPEIAAFYESYYKKQNVQLIPKDRVTGFQGTDSKIQKVVLESGKSLDADIVVVGVGAVANTELFQDQLSISVGGVQVNELLCTSVKDVYAIGDMATFPLKNMFQRLEHVDNCRKMAAHAINAILDENFKTPYEYLPYFYSRIFDLSWRFYGEATGECVAFTHGDNQFPGAYWVKDGKIVGTFLESGSPEQFDAILKLAKVQPAISTTQELKEQGIIFASKF